MQCLLLVSRLNSNGALEFATSSNSEDLGIIKTFGIDKSFLKRVAALLCSLLVATHALITKALARPSFLLDFPRQANI